MFIFHILKLKFYSTNELDEAQASRQEDSLLMSCPW